MADSNSFGDVSYPNPNGDSKVSEILNPTFGD